MPDFADAPKETFKLGYVVDLKHTKKYVGRRRLDLDFKNSSCI